mmetsp:Transcript_10846/g.32297  ORF Transcript_10846/g.32297 Transcript_10846/m.32297 type:complete len:468 (-) Transcript_10846:151-1554(-)
MPSAAGASFDARLRGVLSVATQLLALPLVVAAALVQLALVPVMLPPFLVLLSSSALMAGALKLVHPTQTGEVTNEEVYGSILLLYMKSAWAALAAVLLAIAGPFQMISSLARSLRDWQVARILQPGAEGTSLRTPTSVLITGASSGIGAELARQYAKPGVRLVLTARRVAKLDAVKVDCESRGAVVVTAPADVTNAEMMASIVAAADEDAPLDLVIANAGCSESNVPGGSPLWHKAGPVNSTNVMGVVNTVSPAMERMVARGHGQLVIMASVASAGSSTNPSSVSYAASKVWGRAYGQGLRGALKGTGVGVTTICPGFVDSEMVGGTDARKSGWLPSTNCPGFAKRFLASMTMPTGEAVRHMIAAIGRNAGVVTLPWWYHLSLWAPQMPHYNLMPPFVEYWLAPSNQVKAPALPRGTKGFRSAPSASSSSSEDSLTPRSRSARLSPSIRKLRRAGRAVRFCVSHLEA